MLTPRCVFGGRGETDRSRCLQERRGHIATSIPSAPGWFSTQPCCIPEKRSLRGSGSFCWHGFWGGGKRYTSQSKGPPLCFGLYLRQIFNLHCPPQLLGYWSFAFKPNAPKQESICSLPLAPPSLCGRNGIGTPKEALGKIEQKPFRRVFHVNEYNLESKLENYIKSLHRVPDGSHYLKYKMQTPGTVCRLPQLPV